MALHNKDRAFSWIPAPTQRCSSHRTADLGRWSPSAPPASPVKAPRCPVLLLCTHRSASACSAHCCPSGPAGPPCLRPTDGNCSSLVQQDPGALPMHHRGAQRPWPEGPTRAGGTQRVPLQGLAVPSQHCSLSHPKSLWETATATTQRSDRLQVLS